MSFTPPSGFQRYDQATVQKMWPGAEAPQIVMGNKSTSASISYTIRESSLPPGATPDMVTHYKEVMVNVFTHVHWKKAELVTLAGQPWVYLEMSIPSQKVHNIMLCTHLEGKILMMAFKSTLEEFPTYEARLRQSIQSIKRTVPPAPKKP